MSSFINKIPDCLVNEKLGFNIEIRRSVFVGVNIFAYQGKEYCVLIDNVAARSGRSADYFPVGCDDFINIIRELVGCRNSTATYPAKIPASKCQDTYVHFVKDTNADEMPVAIINCGVGAGGRYYNGFKLITSVKIEDLRHGCEL